MAGNGARRLDQTAMADQHVREGDGKPPLLSIHDLLFAGDVNPINAAADSLFSNTLVLPGFNLYEALKIDDPKKLEWKKHFFDLRGRHLEQAVFDGADLTKADLMARQLRARVARTRELQGASLDRGAASGRVAREGAASGHVALMGATSGRVALWGAAPGRVAS